MKKLLIFLLAIPAFLMACHNDSDELYTMAEIEIVPDSANAATGVTVDSVWAKAEFQNVNTRRQFSSDNFSGNTLHIELERGLYRIFVEGTLTGRDADGKPFRTGFRSNATHGNDQEIELANPVTSHASMVYSEYNKR